MKKSLCTTSIWFIGLFAILVITSDTINAQTISKTEALAELNYLSESIVTYNPALSNYQPDFDSLVNTVINQPREEQISIFDHFTDIARICAFASEGHFNLGNWKDQVHKGFLDNQFQYLPLKVIYTSNTLYVHRDYSNEQKIKPGAQIISINGLKIESILRRLLDCMPSDGVIKTYAYEKIASSFNWLYYVHIEQVPEFIMTYSTLDNLIQTDTISAIALKEQNSNYQKYRNQPGETDQVKPDQFYELEIKEDYSILTLPSFDRKSVDKFKVKPKRMYDEIFKELMENSVDNLIVDLRNNTGGINDFADQFVSYIPVDGNQASFLKKTISWEGKERVYKMPDLSKYQLNGQIYVLVNGMTYSAGSSLTRYLKEYGNAIIIGSETGTRYEGFAGGSTEYVTLPHSDIRIGIPRYHILFPESSKQSTKDRGVLPDYAIKYSFQDRIEGIDRHIEKALLLFSEDK